MIKYKIIAAIAAGIVVSGATSQAALTINFGGMADLQFNGNNTHEIEFLATTSVNPYAPPVGSQWSVTSTSSGSAASLFDLGYFGTQKIVYGAIANVGASTKTAPISDMFSSTLTIVDGAGKTLIGTVKWNEISTFDGVGGVGGINTKLVSNVSIASYAGIEPDLLALFTAGSAVLNISFQNSDTLNLSTLTSQASMYGVSYSGSLTAVPEPATYVAGLGALMLFGFTLVSKRK